MCNTYTGGKVKKFTGIDFQRPFPFHQLRMPTHRLTLFGKKPTITGAKQCNHLPQ